MSAAQKIILALVPKSWATAMEAESRQWHAVCLKCGHAKSVWDMGGIRWKAFSRGERKLQKCTPCNKMRWCRYEKRSGS